MHNAIVTFVYYSVMQYTCSFFVLKDDLITAHYCAIMFMFSQFKKHPNMGVIMTALQSVWLRNHLPVSARNKEILLQNVLTGSGTHPISYWATGARLLGLNWPGHEADSSNPSSAII